MSQMQDVMNTRGYFLNECNKHIHGFINPYLMLSSLEFRRTPLSKPCGSAFTQTHVDAEWTREC